MAEICFTKIVIYCLEDETVTVFVNMKGLSQLTRMA